MFDNKSQLLPTTTTAAVGGTGLTGRGQLFNTVSVLHQNEGGIRKSIPNCEARGSREISGAEGIDFPISPEF